MRMWVWPRAFLPPHQKNNRVHVSHVFMFLSAESATGGAGENQDAL